MAWQNQSSSGLNMGDIRVSLIIDAFRISEFAGKVWLVENGVKSWIERVKAFDDRCYPIIESDERLKARRLEIIRKLRRLDKNNDEQLMAGYHLLFRFENQMLARIDAYGEISEFIIGKRTPVRFRTGVKVGK